MSLGQKTKTKQKQYCNKFNKDFKNGPHKKKKPQNLKKAKPSQVTANTYFLRPEPKQIFRDADLLLLVIRNVPLAKMSCTGIKILILSSSLEVDPDRGSGD